MPVKSRRSHIPLDTADRRRATEPDLPLLRPPVVAPAPRLGSLVIVHSNDLREICRRVELDPGTGRYAIGRAEGSAVTLDHPRVSRHHAHVEHRDGEWWLVDDHSTNGTLVNDARAEVRRLESGDRVQVGETIFKYIAASDIEGQYFATIRTAMITDGLTRALTHAAFRERLDGEFRRSRRYNRPVSLVLIDLDYFKLVNDQHGHLAGDTVLRDVSGMILSRVRREESLGRLGGEEFAILLPETELGGAKVLARDLQDRVRAARWDVGGATVQITASFGVVTLTAEMTAPESLLERADTLLYAAKGAGRNRMVADDPSEG
jgi:two-component system, cell cycle response regulator